MPESRPGPQNFVSSRMRDFAKGGMRTGVGGVPARRGAVVTKPKQAVAIALSEARGKGMNVPPVRPANPGPGFWSSTAKGSPPPGAAKIAKPQASRTAARGRIFDLLSRGPR